MSTLAFTVSQKSLTKNFIIQSMKRKKIGQVLGRIRRRTLVRNPTIQYIIINLHTKYDFSLTKNFIIQSLERKKIGQIHGRIRRQRLVCNPIIQHDIINLYTKCDYPSLQGCEKIFDDKVLWNYGRKDGRMDGMTDRCKPVYPPLSKAGV